MIYDSINNEKIKKIIESSDIVLFAKGTVERPMCGFSAKTMDVLKSLGVAFKTIDVLDSEEIRSAVKVYSDWPTIPQLYLKGEFVGGCDIVLEMYKNNDLQEMLRQKNLLPQNS